MLSFCTVLLVLVSASQCWAQADATSSAGGPYEIGIHGGYLLPSGIAGMTNILPLFGFRYGLGVPFGAIELDASNAHAEGVDWTNLSLSARGSTPLFPGALALFYGGLDETLYRPTTSSGRKTQLGFHFGGGLMLKIIDSFWLRADAKLMSRPGSSLDISVGLVYRGF